MVCLGEPQNEAIDSHMAACVQHLHRALVPVGNGAEQSFVWCSPMHGGPRALFSLCSAELVQRLLMQDPNLSQVSLRFFNVMPYGTQLVPDCRSEERRVGKEARSGWA